MNRMKLLTGVIVLATAFTRDDIRKHVRAGIEWLNENLPDWKNTFNVWLFDIRDGHWCVLSQAFRDVFGLNPLLHYAGYLQAKLHFEKDHVNVLDTQSLGFALPFMFPYEGTEYYLVLEDQWLREMLKMPELEDLVRTRISQERNQNA